MSPARTPSIYQPGSTAYEALDGLGSILDARSKTLERFCARLGRLSQDKRAQVEDAAYLLTEILYQDLTTETEREAERAEADRIERELCLEGVGRCDVFCTCPDLCAEHYGEAEWEVEP
jgi:hypothetical protein